MSAAFTLARWFQAARVVNLPEDDITREQVIDECYRAERVGVRDNTVIAQTPHGVCIIERKSRHAVPVVEFDFVDDARLERVSFWMNASSVADLGAALRRVQRVSFDDLFVHGRRAS